jgi:hypothetical protein
VDPGHLHQNEVRKIKPDQEAEIAFKMHPGRIVKCKVDSIMWATAQGQLPIGSHEYGRRCRADPAEVSPCGCCRMARIRISSSPPARRGRVRSIPTAAHDPHPAQGDHLRVSAKLDWLILKLH